MAPRKNAKGGGGNSSSGSSSSSSGSGSGSPGAGTSGGSSSSPGARRDTKHGGHKNGRKGGLSGSSFFTWFMVIALLGVWTSVAVVWFDLVDYEEVLGKLGVYDADGDGDFDVDDAKVLLGLTKDGSNENIDSLEEVLNILAEESSDWFYGFLSFLYDIMTPFEMLEEEEEESETADGVDVPCLVTPFEKSLIKVKQGAREPLTSVTSFNLWLRLVLEGLKERSASKPTGSGPQNIDDEVQEQIQSLHHEAVYTEHGDDMQQEEEGPARKPPQEDDDFLTGSDADDRFEPLDAGAFHEEIEDSYHVEETASQVYNQDMEEMMYEQDNPDPMEPVAGGEERTYHDADDITYQDYDEPVYEPSENEGIESSDNTVEDSNIILEEAHVPPAEEQQEVPPGYLKLQKDCPHYPQEDQPNHTLQKMAVIDLVT
ncbi:aspartyl/asparaginyl beta-hydroxylase isoform X7 [Prionailurus iriomotensis]